MCVSNKSCIPEFCLGRACLNTIVVPVIFFFLLYGELMLLCCINYFHETPSLLGIAS